MKTIMPALALAFMSSAALAAPPASTDVAAQSQSEKTSSAKITLGAFGPALIMPEPKKNARIVWHLVADRVCQETTTQKTVIDDNSFHKRSVKLTNCFKPDSKQGVTLLAHFDPKIIEKAMGLSLLMRSSISEAAAKNKDIKLPEMDDGKGEKLGKRPKFHHHLAQPMTQTLSDENMIKLSLSKDGKLLQVQKTLVLENGGIFCIESTTLHSTAKITPQANLARQFSTETIESCQHVDKLSKADNQLYLETIMTDVASRPAKKGTPVYKADYKIDYRVK